MNTPKTILLGLLFAGASLAFAFAASNPRAVVPAPVRGDETAVLDPAVMSQVARAQAAAARITTEAEIESERLRNLLLSTFSMDLPKPLKIISDAAAELLRPENINDKATRNELIQKIREEAKRLSGLSAEMTDIIRSKE